MPRILFMVEGKFRILGQEMYLRELLEVPTLGHAHLKASSTRTNGLSKPWMRQARCSPKVPQPDVSQ